LRPSRGAGARLEQDPRFVAGGRLNPLPRFHRHAAG
jgi:hypothetical protein